MDKLKHILIIAFVLMGLVVALTSLGNAFDDKQPLSDTQFNSGSANPWLNAFQVVRTPKITLFQGWNPVDNWQIQQCEINLETEATSLEGGSPDQPYFFSSGAQITAQAEKRLTTENTYENNLGWFIQTFDDKEDYTISITFKDGSSKALSEIVEGYGSGKASPTGTSNFVAWTSTKEPLSAKVATESASLSINFVDKEVN